MATLRRPIRDPAKEEQVRKSMEAVRFHLQHIGIEPLVLWHFEEVCKRAAVKLPPRSRR